MNDHLSFYRSEYSVIMIEQLIRVSKSLIIKPFVTLFCFAASLVYGIPSRKLFSKGMNETLAKLSYRRHNAHVLMVNLNIFQKVFRLVIISSIWPTVVSSSLDTVFLQFTD